jgi:hypothetical protein
MSNGSHSESMLDEVSGPIAREKRYAVFLRGVIGRAGSRNRMPLIVRNISAHGLRGECAYPPQTEDEVEIELPGLGAVAGHVRWESDEAFGVEFDGPIDPTQAFARNRPGVRRSGLLSAH